MLIAPHHTSLTAEGGLQLPKLQPSVGQWKDNRYLTKYKASQWKRDISNPCSRTLHSFFFVFFWRLAYNDVVQYLHQLACSVDQNVDDPHSCLSRLFKNQMQQLTVIKFLYLHRKCFAVWTKRSLGPDLDQSLGFEDPSYIRWKPGSDRAKL
ncbi:hypothetical protein CHARACLAT_026976 [Characodon lateralis]|uniref:Uncharacterized protein n=1 Tax=Characodon lateralis TaxID=208331 RepID=A0ABU7D3C0_9TELE|nr:hypothetical protein [Characodon lateralis]